MALKYGWEVVPVAKEWVETYLSERDRNHADFLFQSVLENNPTGITSSWSNVTTGYSSTVTPISAVAPKDQPACRDYIVIVNIGGNEAHGYDRYLKETSAPFYEDAGF